jgi:hypothetical protein
MATSHQARQPASAASAHAHADGGSSAQFSWQRSRGIAVSDARMAGDLHLVLTAGAASYSPLTGKMRQL